MSLIKPKLLGELYARMQKKSLMILTGPAACSLKPNNNHNYYICLTTKAGLATHNLYHYN